MSTSFYNKVLNRLETFYEPSSHRNQKLNQMSQAQEILNKPLGDSNQLKRPKTSMREYNRSYSTKEASMNKMASSSENSFPQNNNSPLRDTVFIPDKQKQIDQLEEILQEERTKNSSYLNEIYHLNQRIEELEYHIKEVNRTKGNNQFQSNNRDLTYSYEKNPNQNYSQNLSPSSNTNDNTNANLNSTPNSKCNEQNNEFDMLLKENEELRKFKEEVYAISKEYDNVNENVIVSLQEMDKLFSKINEAKYHMTYTKKAQELTKAQASFENVINTIIEMMKGKQDEYNLLIKEREKEVLDLKNEIESYNNKVSNLEENLKVMKRQNEHCCYCCCCHHHHSQGCYECPHHHQNCLCPELYYMKQNEKE